MRHFFLDEIRENTGYVLDSNDVHHISRVLRMRLGDRVSCAYDGKKYLGQLESISKDQVQIQLLEEIEEAAYPEIHLYQALAKGQKIETILQHGTELGIRRFGLFPSRYSDVKNVQRKKARYERIIKDAAKQSQGSYLPQLVFYNKLSELSLDEDRVFVCYENEEKEKIRLENASGTIGLLIGPEGGFSPEEVDYLSERASLVSLGPRILRTETAGLVATSVVLKELGIL